ncbi:hypothetical protein GJS32_03430 [Streptococcus equi subsp. zooepidemicus]|nr:hypothetical protein GJS32_03430 [Streptococcus equi subsp. zooepidemicus]QGM19486.1 hypothetical protein GJS34_03430 [Streptococcus equi subsp. zooepidemicus]
MRGYYVSTIGLNEKTVAKYIREQEKDDISLDKLSVKEREVISNLYQKQNYQIKN